MNLKEAIKRYDDITLDFVESYKQGFEYKGKTEGNQKVIVLCEDGIENYKTSFLPKESVGSLQYEITTLIVGKEKYNKEY